jgi:CHAD domain-containing protein
MGDVTAEMALSVDELARSALSAQVAALLEHEPGVRVGEDIEAVHQMRVATRRLRAALSLFGDVAPGDAQALRGELGWLADRLGAVRDLDVQLAALRQVAEELLATTEALSPVRGLFEVRRATARDELMECLDSARFAALLGSLAALVSVEVEEWPEGAHVLAVEALPDRLRRRYQRFRKATRAIDSHSPAPELHRARIRAKQLRYSLEFSAPVYGKPARALIRRATALQDVLGAIQDAVVMHDHLQAMSLAGRELPPGSIFLAGQLAERFTERALAGRAEVPRAVRRVRRARWKRLTRHFDCAASG